MSELEILVVSLVLGKDLPDSFHIDLHHLQFITVLILHVVVFLWRTVPIESYTLNVWLR